ncbi:MAG: phosphoribosylanthranilate isomerase [Clostridium sp.]|uniref:phosphoribosylanthranilate isomerase n=1 Tax=Clostridium sp. DSM 8431 TaxID=1761781 RepID=UPI0008E0D03F|nr:phosphoribosylanthranilate isomerase [Clostridium sp. DSM 8431]MCR4943831.1 phosphoribosylanthranilate isomerase [Clostridium sp.]SFU48019.1 phosphoribosylanthranilate isomerase [Clostridium sp. DSM 8431]
MEVKICGITHKDEISALNSLKPDYIGFVFAESKRKVSKYEAKALYELVYKDIKVVGVFRNNSREFIEDILKDIPLDVVQLHGEEDIEFIEYFNKNYPSKVWKGESINSKEDLEKALTLPVSTLILDSKNPGSGKVFPWEYLENIKGKQKIFLAGGINTENIHEAIKIDNIHGIDVSSGVECISKGIRRKDPVKIKKIIEEVRGKHER